MNDLSTTKDNFILPAPPVGGLPIPQYQLARMKLVRDRTIPITLPSGKNILSDTMFKISVGYTKLGMREIQGRLGSRVCLLVTSNTNMAGYPTKNNVLLSNCTKTHFRITIPIMVCSSFVVVLNETCYIFTGCFPHRQKSICHNTYTYLSWITVWDDIIQPDRIQ